MSILVEKTLPDGSKALVSKETGEIVYDIVKIHKWPMIEDRKSIDQVSKDKPGELEEWVRDCGYSLSQPDMLTLVEDGNLTDKELRVLLLVGNSIAGQNVVFLTVKEIMDKIGLNNSQVSKILKALEDKNYIVLEHRNTFGVGSRVLAVNPRYFWKGNYAVRNSYQRSWDRKSSPDVYEVLYSCPLGEGFYTKC